MPSHDLRPGFALFVAFAVAASLHSAVIERRDDAWILDTGLVRKEVRLRSGQLVLSSFRNEVSGREYVAPTQASPEFRVVVDGTAVSGATGGWSLAGDRVAETEPGVWQLDLKVLRGPLEVEKHYVAYAGTPVIREWVTFANRGSAGFTLSQPCFLAANLMVGQEADVDLSYVTGGGNFNGSQLLKTEPMKADTNRLFDSRVGVQDLGWYSAYLPLLVERNRRNGDGIMAGWDYLGHWALHVGVDTAAKSRGDLSILVAGYTKSLPPGGAIETPKAFIGAFTGDIDALGNLILDWQYRYFWNQTNDAYFARTRWAVDWKGDWLGVGGTPSGDNWGHRLADDLRYVDLMREAGGEILWDDAGWYDKYGSWRGPDWKQTTDYLAKYGMKWALWYPTFLATPTSRVAQEHPEWMAPGSLTLEQSIPATVDWQFKLLSEGVRRWGAFQWRNDGTPGFSASDTDFLQGDRNFRTLVERFKQAHPDCGVDACAGGGRWISYDLARLAESGEYTDGGVGPYSAYYTSLIVPPDKLHNVIDAEHMYYNPGSDHVHLCMDPTWYKDPGDGPDVDTVRKDWDLYRYLRSRGVVGRWSHVFRPAVTGDDPIWYFQRMNQAGSEGLVIIKHAHRGPVYRLTAKRISGAAKNYVFGAPYEMNRISTTGDAELDAGVYQDPTDGKPGYYGWGGEVFGPVNFRYTSGGTEKSFVTDVVRNGAPHLANDRFFGLSFQIGGKPVEVSQLGLISRARDRWLEGADNSGKYRLSLVRADDGSEVASAEIDLSKGHPDRFGFKYAALAHPVLLEPAKGGPVVIRPGGCPLGLPTM
jgi:hypothetical protein